jgi:hypothetical protein
MNSSSAASMMAWRRSAARAARPETGLGAGASGEAAFGTLAEVAFSPRLRLAGLGAAPAFGVSRALGMH